MIERTALAIHIYCYQREVLSFRATPSGVSVRAAGGGIAPKPIAFLTADDADALETWLREERELREAGGPGAGAVKEDE